MNIRKEKEKEFLTQHLGTLKKAKVADHFLQLKPLSLRKESMVDKFNSLNGNWKKLMIYI